MWIVQLASDIAFITAALGAVTFVVTYAIGSAWRSTVVGRAVMRFFVVLSIIMCLVVLFRYWTTVDRNALQWLALILYTWFAVEMWRLVYVLIRTQKRLKKRARRIDDVDR